MVESSGLNSILKFGLLSYLFFICYFFKFVQGIVNLNIKCQLYAYFLCNILICKYLVQSINLIFFWVKKKHETHFTFFGKKIDVLLQNEFNFHSFGFVRSLHKTNNYDYMRSVEFTKNKTRAPTI